MCWECAFHLEVSYPTRWYRAEVRSNPLGGPNFLYTRKEYPRGTHVVPKCYSSATQYDLCSIKVVSLPYPSGIWVVPKIITAIWKNKTGVSVVSARFSVPKWYPSGIQVEPKLYCLVPKLSQRKCLNGTQVISKWYTGGTLKVPSGTKDETKWNGANDCQSGSNMDTIRNSGSQQD